MQQPNYFNPQPPSIRAVSLGAPSLTAVISDDIYILTQQQRPVNALAGAIFIFGQISRKYTSNFTLF